MPLDSETQIDSNKVTNSVSADKDVDGLSVESQGKVAVGDLIGFLPCTPNGVIELIKRSNINLVGKNVVVLGRSKIVGTPCAELCKWNHATVTVCHSKTEKLQEVRKEFSGIIFKKIVQKDIIIKLSRFVLEQTC